MGIREIIGDKRDAILTLAAKHGARNVRVFGSVADGSADEASDVDFLVEMEPGRSLLDLGGLLMDLQNLLGRKVDVVTDAGLRNRIRQRVQEQLCLYESDRERLLDMLEASACATFSSTPTSRSTARSSGRQSRTTCRSWSSRSGRGLPNNDPERKKRTDPDSAVPAGV
jgi:predicted nucleotidyltransferase